MIKLLLLGFGYIVTFESRYHERTQYFGLFFGYTYAPVITSSFKMPQSIYCEQNQNEK